MSAETMEAGREMDLLVAERLWAINPDGWPANPDEWHWWGTDEDGANYPRLPQFSTDIRDAWRVMEKLAERFGHVEIEWLPHVMHQWEVYMRDRKVVTSDESAPLAICRAALAATAVE